MESDVFPPIADMLYISAHLPAFQESGKQKAAAVYERHRIITALFIKLGAEPQSAEQNACRVEHVLTEDVFELIKQYVGKSE